MLIKGLLEALERFQQARFITIVTDSFNLVNAFTIVPMFIEDIPYRSITSTVKSIGARKVTL